MVARIFSFILTASHRDNTQAGNAGLFAAWIAAVSNSIRSPRPWQYTTQSHSNKQFPFTMKGFLCSLLSQKGGTEEQ